MAERAANVPVQTRNNHVLRIRKERTDAQIRFARGAQIMSIFGVGDCKSCFFSEFFPLLTT